MPPEFTEATRQRLLAPFADGDVEFLPRGFYNGKARALAYIDARAVQTRLDSVVGVGGWEFDYEVIWANDKGVGVKGRLTVCGVTKCDSGEASAEAGGSDEWLKSAVSDALKRCAVHFGIGRYLYCLDSKWFAYDKEKRQWVERPSLNINQVTEAVRACGGTGAPAAQSASRSTAPESSGDRAAADAPRAPAPSAEGEMVCSHAGCGKPLTRGQHDVSVRAFGAMLCPQHQKEHSTRAAA